MAKKSSRAREAVRGTKADPDRKAGESREPECAAKKASSRPSELTRAAWADSPRERLTARMFLVVEVLLVLVPFAYLAAETALVGGSGSFSEALEGNPVFAVGLITSCCQPFAAYLLSIVARHYVSGDVGYAVSNLIGILCAEMFFQNLVGIAGAALLLWRLWSRCSGQIGAWAHERHVGGVLLDISGAIVLLVMGMICSYASWRLGL